MHCHCFVPRTTHTDEHFVAYKVHQTKTETLYYTGFKFLYKVYLFFYLPVLSQKNRKYFFNPISSKDVELSPRKIHIAFH